MYLRHNLWLFHSIDKRRKEVMDRRQKVKDQAAERHNALLGSQAFQEFKRDAAEVGDYTVAFYNSYNPENEVWYVVKTSYLICQLICLSEFVV